MRRPFPALLGFLTLACGDPLAPLPDGGPPTELRYEFSAWPDHYTGVHLAGDTVVLTSRGYGAQGPFESVTRRAPSADEWRAFWKAVADAGVRRWPGECVNTSVLDGGGFSFELAWGGGRRSGVYDNAYPTRVGRCSPDPTMTPEARTFTDAVLALAGMTFVQQR